MVYVVLLFLFFFFKQKTAYDMRISDWSSDVCSSDLRLLHPQRFDPKEYEVKFLTHSARNIYRIYRFCWNAHERTMLAPPAYSPSSIMSQIGRASCRERVCQYV